MKKPLVLKKTTLIISALVIVIGISLAYFLIKSSSEESEAWYNSNWLYRRSIFVSNLESQIINEDVLIEYDTKSLIQEGKLQEDCDDLRFIDSDNSTSLSYWIEGGCNTQNTQIWVRIPKLPESGETIYMYYGNESVPNGQEEWTGEFFLMKDSSCTDTWNIESDTGQDFYQRFPKGASVYGETGGTSSHLHPQTALITGYQIGTQGNAKSGSNAQITGVHTHTVSLTSQSTETIPPYLDMVICSNKNLVINNGLLSLFDSSIPSGFTRFKQLDNKFPRGNSVYGASSGETMHTHIVSATIIDGASGTVTAESGTSVYTASSTHTHSINQFVTESSESIPRYTTVIYSQAEHDSMAPQGTIVMASALPPLGWTRFTQLDEYYPYGSSSYGTTGGASSHTHDINIDMSSNTGTTVLATGIPSVSVPVKNSHTHNITGTLQSYSNDPPYIKVLFIKKNSSKRTTINNEEIPNQPPSSPVNLLTEGLVNPHSVTDQTPEFSAIYSDPNLDNGIYFEIQVNTKTDFTGTNMWNSGKQSISPIISGQRSPEISYMGKSLSLNNATYYWRIRFWDNKDTEGKWSQTAIFTTSTNTTALVIPPKDKDDWTKQTGGEVLGESNTIPNSPSSLYTEGSSNPTKVTDTTPEFSAIFSDPDAGDSGVYYEIEVNTQSDFFGTVMWDSNKTAVTSIPNGSRSPDISYSGTALSLNGTTYYWRIRFWDNNGAVSNWSETANFTMSGKPFAPTYLKTDGMENPTWILSTTPKFSAQHTDPNNDSAAYYEIEVNSNSSFTGTVMWDSNKTSMTSTPSGSRSPDITYTGTALTGNSGTIYYWRIRFWDSDNNVSDWSSIATFKDLIQNEEYIQMERVLLEKIKINPTNQPPFAPSNLAFSSTVLDPNFGFSATFSDPNSSDTGIYYEIEINTMSDFSGTVKQDTGKTSISPIANGSSSGWIELPSLGRGLYYWRIRFWDNYDEVSTWSTSSFYIGIAAP